MEMKLFETMSELFGLELEDDFSTGSEDIPTSPPLSSSSGGSSSHMKSNR